MDMKLMMLPACCKQQTFMYIHLSPFWLKHKPNQLHFALPPQPSCVWLVLDSMSTNSCEKAFLDLFTENSLPDAFAEWCASDLVGLTTVRLFGARVEEKGPEYLY